MGTFTANFDLGMLVGSPAVGAAAALGGYSAAFYLAAAASLGCAALSSTFIRESPGSRSLETAPAGPGAT